MLWLISTSQSKTAGSPGTLEEADATGVLKAQWGEAQVLGEERMEPGELQQGVEENSGILAPRPQVLGLYSGQRKLKDSEEE